MHMISQQEWAYGLCMQHDPTYLDLFLSSFILLLITKQQPLLLGHLLTKSSNDVSCCVRLAAGGGGGGRWCAGKAAGSTWADLRQQAGR